MRCDICGQGTYVTRKLERHDIGALVGLDGATLTGADGQVCNQCGEVMLAGETLDKAMEALVVVLAVQDGALSAGEVRYLRKALEMTQEQLAERLGLHRTTVARWESAEVAIGQAESMAIRALAAMKTLDQHPRLSKEIASQFVRPTATRRHGPYEITVRAA